MPELRTVRQAPHGLRYEVVLGDDARDLQLLNEIGVLDGLASACSDDVPRRLVERHCCLVAFLRGMFLGCGSISSPGSAGARRVHASRRRTWPPTWRRLLGRLDLTFHVAGRERNVACYTKRGETAADLLAVLGAHDARLRWEEHLVLGQVRESANRLANCDEANARRAARPAAGRSTPRAAHGARAVGRPAAGRASGRRAAPAVTRT